MKATRTIIAALPLAMLLSQPALAAEPAGSGGTTHTGAFAGIQLRMNLGQSKRTAPTARLRLGMTHHVGDLRSGTRALDGGAIELGLTRLGRPDLFVGGQSVRGIRQRYGLAPLATALVVVGGAAVSAFAVSELADEDLYKKQCLLPEKELCKE